MSKQKKISENAEKAVDAVMDNAEQAVDSRENIATQTTEEKSVESVEKAEKKVEDQNVNETVTPQTTEKAPEKIIVQKSGGKGLAALALLVALAVGGAGHFMTNKKFAEVESNLQAVAEKANQEIPLQTKIDIPNFDAEKVQITALTENYQKALDRIEQLENQQKGYSQQIQNLQLQLQKVGNMSGSDKASWLLSDADFLLNNAVRKIVLDNDIETAKNLLLEADQVLAQLPNSTSLREAIKADLNTLANLNNVDQNTLMQRVASLTTKLDDLPIFENEQNQNIENDQVTDSLEDWQSNLEKNASSFLDRFIRVSKRNATDEKAFVAPNQEIYLRENIRLRLQIAILAIPRQQNELYKKSLQTVSSWIRSYFDTTNENVKTFLKEIDELSDETIYVDAPDTLQSLKALQQRLNKAPQTIEKVEITAEQELEQVEPVKSESQEAPSSAQ